MCCSQKNVLIFFDRYLYFTSSSWSFSAVHLRAVANRISDTINSLPTELNLSISPESSSSFIFCIIIIIFHGNQPQKEGSQKKLDFMGNPRVKALSSFMKFGTDSQTLGGESVSSDWESFQYSSTLTMYLKNCRSERCRACGKSSGAEWGSRDFEPINTSGSHSNIYIWIVPFFIAFLFLHYIVAAVCCTAAGERSTDLQLWLRRSTKVNILSSWCMIMWPRTVKTIVERFDCLSNLCFWNCRFNFETRETVAGENFYLLRSDMKININKIINAFKKLVNINSFPVY